MRPAEDATRVTRTNRSLDPIRALIWLEAFAAALAFAADVMEAIAVNPYSGMVHPTPELLYAGVSLITAVAIFCIPHAANRRYVAVVVASAGVVALGYLPPHALLMPVLACILSARLTFAFGLRGAAGAFAITVASLVLGVISFASGSAVPGGTAELVLELFANAVIIGLIFGVIAIVWWYARKTAEAAASAERSRIALDLHDSLGHGLTTLSVQLQNAARLRPSDPLKADWYVDRACANVGELLSDVRETVRILHDDVPAESAPFRTLLDRLHADFASTYDVEVRWNVRLAGEPSGRIAIACYRVLQEALTNVARHARAARVAVAIDAGAREIELRVEDDGRGFDGEPQAGHGLASMRTRVESLGGTIAVTSTNGRGTLVRALVPLEAGA